MFILVLIVVCSCKEEKEQNKKVIDTLGWYSIPDGDATLERYQEMKNAGFTYTFTHTNTLEEAKRALDLSQRVGLKSVLKCNELESDPEKTVREVMNHPGLGLYFLKDQPAVADFNSLGEWARKIDGIDRVHGCYLNLLPRQAFPNTAAYEDYLRQFDRIVNLPQISFDHYPIIRSDDKIVLTPYFYENLELISKEAKQVGKPFWGFALATAHLSYPMPTIGHLRLQVYSNLAYGAQMIEYFTYWNPGTEQWDFHQAPITLQGKRSPVYELVRSMNKEIQIRAEIFKDCTVDSVYHVGNNLPIGTKRLPSLPQHFTELDTHGNNALVSTIKNNGYTYIIIQNTSPTNDFELNIRVDDQIDIIRFDGTSDRASKYGRLFILTVGNILIFRY